MERKKVIFMDVDGVLNYTKWYVDDRNPGNLYGQEGDIDPRCVKRIVDICNRTGAGIVLSSDWRYNTYSISRLERAGFPKGLIFDITPVLTFDARYASRRVSRGMEIAMWLENHPDTYDYVIIDDREDFTDEQKRYHFVHVNPMVGFTNKDRKKAIEILSR